MKWIWALLFATVVKSDQVSYLNILQYENVTIADINTICSYFQGADITEKCSKQLDIVCENPATLALTMLDASSKFPYSGLAFSARSDYGNYDQCLTVDHTYSGGRILGEFCAVGLVLPDFIGNKTDIDSLFKLAVCRPNECSASDYNSILRYSLSLSDDFPGLFVEQSCSTVESHSTFSTGDIIVLSIFGFVILLMVISTLYDLHLYYSNRKTIHPLLLAFSVLTNGRKLMHISKHSTSKEQVETFHGFRVISMMWVVAGHGIGTYEYGFVTDVSAVNNWPSLMSSFYMNGAHLAVDTFFFMSGFLLAFQYFKGRIGTLFRQIKSVPHMIVHRYLRLTPAMAMIYLVTITFFLHMGNGPIYAGVFESSNKVCRKYWWRFFLYIQNYYDFADICLLQTWYLSADMQLFLISPLFLIPLSLQFKRFGYRSLIWGLLLVNIFFTFLPMVLKLTIRDYTNDYDTHSRLVDYFIGVMLGAFMRLRIDKPFLYMISEGRRLTINLITWLLIILGMMAIVMCYHDQGINHSFESRTVFEALMRPAWCIGLSWITYSCYHGHGSFVNWVLCRPIFQALGRLTYCIYLLHVTVIMYFMGTVRTKMHFSDYNAFYQFCGHYVVTVIVSIFWTLAFESPLITIEKYLLGGSKPKAKQEQPVKVASVEEGTDAASRDKDPKFNKY